MLAVYTLGAERGRGGSRYGSNAPPSRHHRATTCYRYCYRVTLPEVTLSLLKVTLRQALRLGRYAKPLIVLVFPKLARLVLYVQ